MVLNTSNTMYIGPVDTYAGGSILYGTAAGVSYQRWYTGASERMRITPSGNVGIGTTSPQNTLHVDGTLRVGPYFATSDRDHFLVTPGGTVTTVSTPNENANYDNSGGNIHIRTNSGYVTPVERLTVLAGGDVGIGTTSPGYKLDVTGDARFGDGNNFNPLIQYAGSGRTAGSPGYSFVGDLNTGMFNPNLSNTLAFSTGGSERMRINSSGNVGIGTTSPDAKLDIEGDEASLRIKDTTSGKTWDWQVHSTYMEFGEVNVANNRLVIKNGGNVGIGTTDPQSKLQVAGGIQMADDAATAVAAKVGTLRYRTSGNNSYVDMCMQTAASTYAWINIVQNNW
jgi:hypothetical protein